MEASGAARSAEKLIAARENKFLRAEAFGMKHLRSMAKQALIL